MTTCNVDGCDRRRYCRGMCSAHYKRWHRDGQHGPSTIEHRDAGRNQHQAESARRRREERFEDIRYLMSWAVHPDEIAQRVGATRAAIERQAYKWGEPDIARYMADRTEKTKPCPDCDAEILHGSTRCVDCARIARWAQEAAA